MNKKILRMLITIALIFATIHCTAFAAIIPEDEIVEPDSNRWIREDVVTITEGILYSDDGMKRAVYEETKTEVYRVNISTGQRLYYHTRYDVVWTGQFRANNSPSGVWITDSDFVDVHYSDIERNVIYELMLDTMDFMG